MGDGGIKSRVGEGDVMCEVDKLGLFSEGCLCFF